jgi:hypothetical protein
MEVLSFRALPKHAQRCTLPPTPFYGDLHSPSRATECGNIAPKRGFVLRVPQCPNARPPRISSVQIDPEARAAAG